VDSGRMEKINPKKKQWCRPRDWGRKGKGRNQMGGKSTRKTVADSFSFSLNWGGPTNTGRNKTTGSMWIRTRGRLTKKGHY